MSSLSPTTLAPAASPLASIAEPWRVLEDSRPPTLAMLASATSRLAEDAHDLAAMLTIIRLATSTGDLVLAKRYATAAIADCEGRNDLQSLSAVSCFITRSVDPDWGLNLVLKKCIAGGRFEMGNPCYEEALKAVGLQSLLRDLMQSGAAAGKMYNVNGFSGIDVEQQQANRAKGYGYAFLNTMPKSGSVFLADHLASLYRTPFARIGVDSFPRSLVIPGRAEVLAQGGLWDQMHLDASPENLDQLERAGIRKIYLHVRDPRQATLSWAHHLESADMTGGNAVLSRGVVEAVAFRLRRTAVASEAGLERSVFVSRVRSLGAGVAGRDGHAVASLRHPRQRVRRLCRRPHRGRERPSGLLRHSGPL